ncbi:HD-GYP domain-containing protein [Bryobacter aggregatus]|uniref:HD-GYP domain-containing protein n=1 Tax=Bryobacter aggregatus TaxID=360054 RepID=UPI00068F06F5|nr:HD domain-containing phosphohydrolase [Bryobacter aggregatus]
MASLLNAAPLAAIGEHVELFTAHDTPPTILLVDSTELNRRVIRATLNGVGSRFLEAKRPSEAFAILDCERVDLVICDMFLPELNGMEFCRRLKANRATQLLPILMLTSVQGAEHEVAGLTSGADEYLLQPAHPSILKARVQSMLRHKAALDSLDEVESILFTLAQAVEERDKCTSDHCRRLSYYSVEMGIRLGLGRNDLLALHRGGYLHDIGKIGIPDSILNKKGRLNPEEWNVMRSHVTRGEEICRPMKSLEAVLPIIRHHHERWDGTGYPDELKGSEIPLLARILQTADVFDALTSERPYKAALSPSDACRVLETEALTGWRDPELVPLFVNMIENDNDASRMSSSLRAMAHGINQG